ncbi:MAG: hypothetical protein IJC50_06665 [Clostridia bacterium]|nr:hypothetical protein [Clostridia bacterium]
MVSYIRTKKVLRAGECPYGYRPKGRTKNPRNALNIDLIRRDAVGFSVYAISL